MNMYIFFSLFIIIGIFYLYIGKKTATKASSSCEQYLLAGRNTRLLPLMMTFLATQVGGGMIVGAAAEAYKWGWAALMYPLGISLGLICLALGFGKKLKQYNVSTMPELLETVYKSPMLRKAASILSILAMFFILSAQGIAIRQLLVSINISNLLPFFGFWVICIVYTMLGGYRAVVKTDIYQMIFIIIVFTIALILGMKTTTISSNFWQWNTQNISLPWLGWISMPLLFMFVEQDMGQRCFSAKNSKILTTATVTAGILVFILALLPLFFGNITRALNIPIQPNTSVLMTGIQYLNFPILTTFFTFSLFLVIMSTADSLLCAMTSLISFDFISAKTKFSPKKQVYISQAMTAISGMCAAGLSLFYKEIVPLLIQTYELVVCTLFIPIILSIFPNKVRGKNIAAGLSMLFGFLSFFLLRNTTMAIPKEILSLIFSFCGFSLGYFMQREKLPLAEGE